MSNSTCQTSKQLVRQARVQAAKQVDRLESPSTSQTTPPPHQQNQMVAGGVTRGAAFGMPGAFFSQTQFTLSGSRVILEFDGVVITVNDQIAIDVNLQRRVNMHIHKNVNVQEHIVHHCTACTQAGRRRTRRCCRRCLTTSLVRIGLFLPCRG